MKPQPPAIALAQLLASISDPARLRMLRLLSFHELSVGEIAKIFQFPQSSASRQLKILSDAGWIIKRTEGTTALFHLAADQLPTASQGIWTALNSELKPSPDLDEDDRRVLAILDDRKTDSINYFGRVRGEWDHVRADLFGGRFTSAALLALIHPNWVIADVGCGTGNAAELLSPMVEQVIAIDQSGPMLSAAKERLGTRKNIRFIEAPVNHLPITDQSVDAAVCMLVLHHIEDVGAALKEIHRILRTPRGGGILAVVDMVEHDRSEYRRTMGHRHQGFSKKTMLNLLGRAGFTGSVYYELPAEPEAKGPALFVATGRCSQVIQHNPADRVT